MIEPDKFPPLLSQRAPESNCSKPHQQEGTSWEKTSKKIEELKKQKQELTDAYKRFQRERDKTAYPLYQRPTMQSNSDALPLPTVEDRAKRLELAKKGIAHILPQVRQRSLTDAHTAVRTQSDSHYQTDRLRIGKNRNDTHLAGRTQSDPPEKTGNVYDHFHPRSPRNPSPERFIRSLPKRDNEPAEDNPL